VAKKAVREDFLDVTHSETQGAADETGCAMGEGVWEEVSMCGVRMPLQYLRASACGGKGAEKAKVMGVSMNRRCR
jgi:hypothetical protein